MRRATAIRCAVGAGGLAVGSLLPWVTFERGVSPTIASPLRRSKEGGWTLLVAAILVALARGRASRRGPARRSLGALATMATAWAALAELAITDLSILANVSARDVGPARPVMLVGVSLCGAGELLRSLTPERLW